MDVNVSNHFKEELVWATDKQLQVISTIILFKQVDILISKNQVL